MAKKEKNSNPEVERLLRDLYREDVERVSRGESAVYFGHLNDKPLIDEHPEFDWLTRMVPIPVRRPTTRLSLIDDAVDLYERTSRTGATLPEINKRVGEFIRGLGDRMPGAIGSAWRGIFDFSQHSPDKGVAGSAFLPMSVIQREENARREANGEYPLGYVSAVDFIWPREKYGAPWDKRTPEEVRQWEIEHGTRNAAEVELPNVDVYPRDRMDDGGWVNLTDDEKEWAIGETVRLAMQGRPVPRDSIVHIIERARLKGDHAEYDETIARNEEARRILRGLNNTIGVAATGAGLATMGAWNLARLLDIGKGSAVRNWMAKNAIAGARANAAADIGDAIENPSMENLSEVGLSVFGSKDLTKASNKIVNTIASGFDVEDVFGQEEDKKRMDDGGRYDNGWSWVDVEGVIGDAGRSYFVDRNKLSNLVKSSPANFVARLYDKDRKTIPDWKDPEVSVSTHKLGWEYGDDGRIYVFPFVQEIDGELKDFSDPKYGIPERMVPAAALESAISHNDYIVADSPVDAFWITDNYKTLFPGGKDYEDWGNPEKKSDGGEVSSSVRPNIKGTSVYSIRKGDNLYSIARNNDLSLDDLLAVNPQITNPSLIYIGDKINIPDGKFEKPTTPYDYSSIRDREAALNASGDNEAIIKSISHDRNFAIIDKKKKRITVYDKNNKELYSGRINSGASGDDYNTITYTDDNNNLIDSVGNNSTPAGITMVSSVGTYHGRPSFIRARYNKSTGEWDDNVASSMHYGGDSGSNGCVRLVGDTANELSKYIGRGTMIYTLPQKEGSGFVVRDGLLSYLADNPYGNDEGDRRYWDDYNVYRNTDYHKLDISPKSRANSDESTSDSVQKASLFSSIKDGIEGIADDVGGFLGAIRDGILDKDGNITLTGAAKEGAQYILDKYYGVDDEGLRDYMMTQYANGVSRNKESIMRDFGLDSGTFNNLAMLAMGIAGQESDWGMSSRYRLKSSIPDWAIDKAKKILRNKVGYRSRGITQMKIKGDNEETKRMYDKYGIDEESLSSPYGASVGTMIRLASIYKNEVVGREFKDKDGNVIDPMYVVLYKWQGGRNSDLRKGKVSPEQNSYIRNVNEYLRRFDYTTYMRKGGMVMSGGGNVGPVKVRGFSARIDTGARPIPVSGNYVEDPRRDANSDVSEMERLRDIYDYLRNNEKHKFNDIQALAITANIAAESSGRIDALGKAGDFGLQQWLGARKSELQRRHGKNPTMEQQLDYLIDEYLGSVNGLGWNYTNRGNFFGSDRNGNKYNYYMYSKKEFDDATSYLDATVAWNQGFGRPLGSTLRNDDRRDIAKRLAEAWGVDDGEYKGYIYGMMGDDGKYEYDPERTQPPIETVVPSQGNDRVDSWWDKNGDDFMRSVLSQAGATRDMMENMMARAEADEASKREIAKQQAEAERDNLRKQVAMSLVQGMRLDIPGMARNS